MKISLNQIDCTCNKRAHLLHVHQFGSVIVYSRDELDILIQVFCTCWFSFTCSFVHLCTIINNKKYKLPAQLHAVAAYQWMPSCHKFTRLTIRTVAAAAFSSFRCLLWYVTAANETSVYSTPLTLGGNLGCWGLNWQGVWGAPLGPPAVWGRAPAIG